MGPSRSEARNHISRLRPFDCARPALINERQGAPTNRMVLADLTDIHQDTPALADQSSANSVPNGERRLQCSAGTGWVQSAWNVDGPEPETLLLKPPAFFEAGTPRPLFQTRILPQVEARNHYDVTVDGQRFVVNSRLLEDASLPITIVVNWASALTTL